MVFKPPRCASGWVGLGAAVPAFLLAALPVTPSIASSHAACATGVGYTVRPGDTWWDLAERSDIDLDALLAMNGTDADEYLVVDHRVCLPASADVQQGAGHGGGTSAAWVALDALPLQGPCWYSDSWHAPRGNGRVHEGMDMFAEDGAYIYAVVDGVLTDRAWDLPGRRAGNAWWLTSADGSGTYFFYGHLFDFAPGLGVGSTVQAGQIIGFLGGTGSAAASHLHFEIHPGGGSAVDPHEIVTAAGRCKTGDGYQQPSGWVPAGD